MYRDQLIINLKYHLQCQEAQLNKYKYIRNPWADKIRENMERDIELMKNRIERLELETKA